MGNRSGTLVIDVDPRNLGDESLAQLIEELGPLPRTYTVATPSEGSHFYFRHVQGAGSLRVPGVDIQSDGRYVVGAGSVIDERPYTVASDLPLATLPPAWIEALLRRPERLVRRSGTVTRGNPVRRVTGLVGFVLNAEEGRREPSLHWSTCRLVDMASTGEISIQQISQAQDALIAAGMETGLTRTECESTVFGVFRRAGRL